MLSSRRTFILGGTAIALGAGSLTWWQTHRRPAALTPLQSLLDTLVPDDEHPGALATGIENHIQTQTANLPAFAKRIERVLTYINNTALTQHRQAFAELGLDQREALLNELLISPTQRQLRSDLYQVRNGVLKHYYASPEGMASLGYHLPAPSVAIVKSAASSGGSNAN